MTAEQFISSDLGEIGRMLADRYPAVVHDILTNIEDDETIRELVAEGVASLVSSAESADSLLAQLAAVLMPNAEPEAAKEASALGEGLRARWTRCLLPDSD